jgi:hypothetical protein
VVVTTLTVGVAMLQLIFAGLAHINDFNREIQGFASQRVVAVQLHAVIGYRDNGYRLFTPGSLSQKLHADFNLFNADKVAALNVLHQVFATLAITTLGLYSHIKLVANGFTNQGRLKTFNDVATAVQIGQRFLTCGCINHIAGGIFQGVVDLQHGIFSYLHWYYSVLSSQLTQITIGFSARLGHFEPGTETANI